MNVQSSSARALVCAVTVLRCGAIYRSSESMNLIFF
jgi:hypothetical protein